MHNPHNEYNYEIMLFQRSNGLLFKYNILHIIRDRN